jgi:ATP/maltotriose-dependent transcriptional regulator MalT
MWKKVNRALERLEERLTRMEKRLMTAIDNLRAQVERNNSVTESAITLLQGIKTQLDNAIASGDPAAIQALSDTLGTETDKLAAAVVANTPAAPTP